MFVRRPGDFFGSGWFSGCQEVFQDGLRLVFQDGVVAVVGFEIFGVGDGGGEGGGAFVIEVPVLGSVPDGEGASDGGGIEGPGAGVGFSVLPES